MREFDPIKLASDGKKSRAYFRHIRWSGKRTCPRCRYRLLYLVDYRFGCRRCRYKFGEFTGRVKEVKEYIDDNKDELGLPDFSHNDIVKCGIASNLVDKEVTEGTTFEGEDLDTNLKLLIIKQSGDAATRLLENPDEYLGK
ncbi:MAG: transposase [Nitrososphaeraceae archaeon]